MPIEIKYIGTQQRWPELATTGKQSVWMPGQIEERDDVEAGKLLATGLFKSEPIPLTATLSSGGVEFPPDVASAISNLGSGNGTVLSDLASSDVGKGASLVTFKQSGIGSVSRGVDSKLRDVVSVKDFGAFGDGVTDDTNAIQNALNAGSIYLPDGTYIVSSLTVPANGRKIIGQSKSAVLKRMALTYLPVIIADGVNYLSSVGFTIDGNSSECPLNGLTPLGGGTSIPLDNQGDIVCRNGAYARVESVSFVNSCTSPVMLYNMTFSVVSCCTSVNHRREGFYIVSGQDNTIDGCLSVGGSSLPWSLIATSGFATDAQPHRHIISNNICYDSQAAFLTINTTETQLFGNIVGKKQGLPSTGPGIRLGHAVQGLAADKSRIFGNYVFGISDIGTGGTGRGISIECANGCEISDNRIINCRTGVGASVTQNTDFLIKGNFADSCTLIGYDIFNVRKAQIINNISRNCPTGISLSGDSCFVKNNFILNASVVGYAVNGSSGVDTNHVFESNSTDALTTNKWAVAIPSHHTYVNNEFGAKTNSIATIVGSTPSVAAGNIFIVNNSAATDMTFLADWKDGAIYTLLFANGNTTLKQSVSFRLNGGVDVRPLGGKVMQFLSTGSLFYEVSRSF